MKIKMYQSGGIYYTPIFRDSPARAQQQVRQDRNSDDKEANLITKEVIKVLEENGLPNDVDNFLAIANNFLNRAHSFWTDNTDQKFDLSDLIRIKSYANKVKHNKELHGEATKQITKEGSGSEAAISSTGELYVYDGEGIGTISLQEYYNNKENYKILTNTELLQLRANAPELVYRDEILNDLSATVGIKSIVEHVKGVINDFGKQVQKAGNESFIAKNKGKIANGFEQLLGSDTPDGIYKLSHKESKSEQGYDQNSKESLQFALNYLYNALPPNMRNVLQAQSVAEGYSPKENGAQKFLYQAILEHTDHEYTVENGVGYQADMSRASGIGGDKSSEKDTKLTRSEMIARIAPDQMLPIQGSTDTTAFLVPSRNVAKPEDKNGKKLGVSTIYDVFKEDPIGHYLAMESVSFGGQLISEQDTRRLMYDGASDLHKAYLPVRTDIYSSTGEIVPDFDAASRFEQFKKWFDDGYGVMPNSIIMKMQELNLDLQQDENGNWHFRNDIVKPFITLNGYASSTAVDFDKKSKWLSHVDRSVGERLYDLYARIVNFGTDMPTKSAKARDDLRRSWFVAEDSSMYKGLICIPITRTDLATLTTNHETVNSDIYRDIFHREEALQQSRIKTTFDE